MLSTQLEAIGKKDGNNSITKQMKGLHISKDEPIPKPPFLDDIAKSCFKITRPNILELLNKFKPLASKGDRKIR